MNNPSPFIIKLKALLPESAWPWVIPALTQDRQVWQTIQDPKFGDLALEQIGANPKNWQPANLALLLLDSKLPSEPFSFDARIRKNALHTYESFLKGQSQEKSDQHLLTQAVLLAIALLEHRRLSGSWKTLPADLQPLPKKIWKTTLACLYGLAPDPGTLLGLTLSQDSSTHLLGAGLHALLSNPLSHQEQSQIIQDVLSLQAMPDWIPVLRSLERNRPQLAADLSNLLLTKQPTFANRKHYQDSCDQVKHLAYLLASFEIQRMAGQMEQGQTLHHLAVDAVEDLYNQLNRQTVDVTARSGDLNKALTQWKEKHITRPAAKPIETIKAPPSKLILSLLENNRIEDALDIIPTSDNSDPLHTYPAYYVVKAHQSAAKGDLSNARKAAKQALVEFITHTEKSSNGSSPKTNLDQNRVDREASWELLLAIANILFDLELPEQALQAAQLVTETHPNNPDALITLARAQCAANEFHQAVDNAHLAAALKANSSSFRQHLADCLEAAGHWQAALIERQFLLDKRFSQADKEDWPLRSDLHALANCAIKAGQPDLGIDTCNQILKHHPEDGLAHTLLGEALIIKGEVQSALDHFQQGTELAPNQAFPWLSLANNQRQKDLPGNAVDTLRQAAQAAPAEPAVHLALAETYLEEKALSQALTSLQHAQGLVTQPLLVSNTNPWYSRNLNQLSNGTVEQPLPCRVATQLGETLRLLGHLKDAVQVLESAYQDYPGSVKLAKTYANTLLSVGDTSKAIEPLKQVVNADPTDLQPYLDYASALLTLKSDPDEAVKILQKAEQVFPNNPQTTALLAEALADSGDLESSQQSFYNALQSNLAQEAEWHSRLSFGLGKVALKLAQPETAVASFQESIRTNPDDPQVHCMLAEAYASLDLQDEALESARVALNQTTDDLDMLTWFSSIAARMGSLDEAISALTRFVEINPEDTGTLLRLGQIQSRGGRVDDARQILKSILSIDKASIEDLCLSAKELATLKDPDSAATFLERAASMLPEPDTNILLDLASAYQQAGRSQQALETLNQAISHEPQEVKVFLAKADLLAQLGRVDDVRNCLEDSVDLHPEEPELRHHLILQLRAAGEISLALSHAVKLVASYRKTPSVPGALKARVLAADLARAMLQITSARSFLLTSTDENILDDQESDRGVDRSKSHSSDQKGSSIPLNKTSPKTEPSVSFSYHCLSAELALDEGEEIAAAESLNQSIEYDPNHPRLLALQARLASRRGDLTTAIDILQNALQLIGKDSNWSEFLDPISQNNENGNDTNDVDKSRSKSITPEGLHLKQELVCALLSISAAAIELGQWDTALYMLRKVVKESPAEPFGQLQLGRTMVLRAEYQRLCQALNVIQHAPGPSALAKETYNSFQNAIQSATRSLSVEDTLGMDSINQMVSYWQDRGQVAFQTQEADFPTDTATETSKGESPTESGYAPILELENLKDLDFSENPLQHSLSLAHLAVRLGDAKQQKEVLEQGIRTAKSAVSQQPKQPIYHALLANLFKSAGDLTTSLDEMLTAISMWPEEPRWQAKTAELYLACGDIPTALDYYHNAVELEPGHMYHHLSLGEAHLLNGDHQLAIESLKQAQRLAPDQLKPNLALARAYIMSQDPTSAAIYTDHAISLAPDQPEPMQLSAEIALQSGDPRTALSRAKTALRLNPDHPDTLCLLARALSKMNQYEEALSLLETAVPLAAEPLPILLERAKLLEASQGSAQALQALQDLIKDYPHETTVLASLARNLAAEGQTHEAIQAAQNALHGRDNNWEPGEQAELHLLLGSLLRQSGQLDQAIHQQSEAIRLSPQMVEAYLELAATQQDRREHILALQTYQKAIEVAPENPMPYYQASLALKDGRDYEGAERMLRQAANLAPDDVSIHRQLAALVALNLVHNRRTVPIEA